jgi:MFS family permease
MAAMASSAPARIGGPRLIAACTIGNALEFYDFVIYSFFATTIGKLFFPAQDPAVQILLSFATYGVGFFLRPLGGAVIGAYADRHGRKPATLLTLMLMAAGTAMIGIAPTYAAIGIWAPLVVVTGRLIQGFSAGGEVGASTTLLAEYAPAARRGFFGSWQIASQGLAVLVAAFLAWSVFTLLPPDSVTAWGWRVPFLLGIAIVPIGLWLRSALKETHANEEDVSLRDVSSLSLVWRDHWRHLLSGIAIVIGGTAANAVVVLYMSTYAVRQLGMSPATGLFAGIAAGAVTLVTAPLGGMLSDRYGRKRIGRITFALLALAIYPGFVVLAASPTLPTLLLVVGVLGILFGTGGGAVIVVLTEIFPTEVRASGMSLVYAVGVAIFGGFGQFIVTWLIQATGSPFAPAYYVIACSLATIVGLATVPETARIALD